MSHGHSHLRPWTYVFLAGWGRCVPKAGATLPQDPRALPDPALEVSVAGQNLLVPYHLKFAHAPGPPAGGARSIVVRTTWTRPDR